MHLFGLFVAGVGVVAGQHHGDPFAGSNCTCATFCDDKCSINPSKPHNITLFRMTPFGVLDLANKNTGDSHGDTSFVLSKKTNAYSCRQDPTAFQCNGLAQFTGDDPNSTDLILSLTVELDGEWGPYLPCNPLNSSNEVKGPWACKTSISPGGTPPPPQCKAGNFTVFAGYCWQGLFPKKVAAANEGDCCAAATTAGITKWEYTDGECSLFKIASFPKPCGKNSTLGYASDESSCNCPRVQQTVGRENLTSSRPSSHSTNSYHAAGGEWYSHPAAGECGPGHHVGDGSGCAWRVVAQNKAINATCMYRRLDANVESHDSSCFAGCAQPHNVTSTCYLKCYSDAVGDMTPDELAQPWDDGFAAAGCPEVRL